jgi:uncharacterized OsmC-like protein
MESKQIAVAMQRVESVFKRRPEMGLHEDPPATARWKAGTRVVTSHANGMQLLTDMPAELGGNGEQVTPGWLFRAGLASCLATRIAMAAAAAGFELASLEVLASSHSDVRGLLGMLEASGETVRAGPRDIQLFVRIGAPGISPEQLRSLVEESNRCSPISAAARETVPVTLSIEVNGG